MDITLSIVLSSLVAGLVGAALMDVLLALASRNSQPHIDMTEALGSLILGKTDGAKPLGIGIHLAAGVFFGLIYGFIMAAAHATTLPFSIFVGMGLGLFQGIFMSYCLMFVVAEKHPLTKYRQATLQTGALHLLGHIVFGAIVGLIVGAFA